MPFWDRFKRNTESVSNDILRYAFVDAEVGLRDHKVHDIAALRFDETRYHQASKDDLIRFLQREWISSVGII